MKYFFDSSYFFPSIGIEVTNVDINFLPNIFNSKKSSQFFYSNITLFELQAKGIRYVQSGTIEIDDVNKGISAILNEPSLIQVSHWSPAITSLSSLFRNSHSDFIDCLLLASGILYSDVIVTEDNKWKELIEDVEKSISNVPQCLSSKEVK